MDRFSFFRISGVFPDLADLQPTLRHGVRASARGPPPPGGPRFTLGRAPCWAAACCSELAASRLALLGAVLAFAAIDAAAVLDAALVAALSAEAALVATLV